MHYSEYTDLEADDRTIACHPIIDACNASIAYRLLEQLGFGSGPHVVLDLGSGTGQMSRFLRGLPSVVVESLDIDPEAERHYREHPELADIQFHRLDFLSDDLPRIYDAIIVRGVYHHIPKSRRPYVLKKLSDCAQTFIVADEGIREYRSESERVENCVSWYTYVIREAHRRGLPELARIESRYLEHESAASADDGGDFKESPSHLLADAKSVGLEPRHLDRFGPWEKAGGGFFTTTFVK